MRKCADRVFAAILDLLCLAVLVGCCERGGPVAPSGPPGVDPKPAPGTSAVPTRIPNEEQPLITWFAGITPPQRSQLVPGEIVLLSLHCGGPSGYVVGMGIDLMSGRSVTRSVEDGVPRSSDPLIAPKGYFNVRAPECDGSLGLSYPVTAKTPDITHAIEYLWYKKGSASGDLRDMQSRPPDATYLVLLSLKKPKP